MSTRKHLHGFSLIEVLVAACVFSILLLLFMQMTSGAGELAGRSKRRMDALVDARSALDRLGFDLDQRVRDAAMPLSVQKLPGSDAITFYVGAQADDTSRPVSSVSYRVRNHLLERGRQSTGWAGTNAVVFQPGLIPVPTDPEFDSLTSAVFRMECNFLLKSTHALSASPPSSWDDVAAVLVSIAVIDRREFDLLDSGQVNAMAGAFPDATDGASTLTAWNSALTNLPTLIPQRAANAVRIHQRCLPVD